MNYIFRLVLIFLISFIGLSAEQSALKLPDQDYFIENKGQWDNEIKFASKSKGLNFVITDEALVFDYYSVNRDNGTSGYRIGNVVKMKFEGSNFFNFTQGFEKLNQYNNYFLGKNSDKWVSNVPLYKKVKLYNIYQGIDLVLSYDSKLPRYDFVIAPGYSPEVISFRFEGAESVKMNENGNLNLKLSNGQTQHGKIFAYQEIDNNKVKVNCSFEIQNEKVSFKVGNYDKTKPLVIDPVVMTSFWGGSDNEEITKIQYIKDGSFIITGWTKSGDLITTAGSYNKTYMNQEDVFITKMTLKGTHQSVDFSTFLGGTSNDFVKGVFVDVNGDIYLTGDTQSPDFPVKGSFQPELIANTDAFVTKLAADGTKLIYSTFIGGGKNDYGTAIFVAKDLSAYVCGYTNSTDFPITSGIYQSKLKGLDDIFLLKITPTGGSLKFSTYIGGTVNDHALALYVDNELTVYLTGETNSGDMPVVPFSNVGGNPWDRPYSSTLMGGYDAFVIKMKGEGSSIDNATYFGGTNDDKAVSIFVDEEYYTMTFAGTTTKESGTQKFPVSGNAVSKINQGGTDCFYAQLEKVKVQAGTGKRQNLLFSTMFGGTGNDVLNEMVWNKDAAGVYMTGTTASTKFPVVGETNVKYYGKGDAFITRFNLTGSEILYSTLLGGDLEDCGNSVTTDERGDILFAGYTNSVNFPDTNALIQKQFNGGATDGFLSKIVFGALFVTSPSGKEKYCQGSKVGIGWNSQFFPVDEKFSVEIGKKDEDQWLEIGSEITGSSYLWTIPNDFPGSSEYYIRVVTKSGLFATHVLPFTINSSPRISDFTSNPTDARVCEGDTVKFQVSSSGSNTTFSWYLDGVQIQNQNDSTLVLNTAIFNKSGKITCVVRGTCLPEAITKAIQLTVIPSTRILSQSSDSKVKIGKDLKLFVETNGSNLKYEWFKDDKKIISQEDSVFLISGASYSHEGIYKCNVTGDCGEVESTPIKVSIDTSTAVNENLIEQKLQLHYNDLENLIVISGNYSKEVSIDIISLNGQIIAELFSGILSSEITKFNLNKNQLLRGTYLIRLRCAEGNVTAKFQLNN